MAVRAVEVLEPVADRTAILIAPSSSIGRHWMRRAIPATCCPVLAAPPGQTTVAQREAGRLLPGPQHGRELPGRPVHLE
jgi:hypothetical protein